jgi:putative Holliday junction resolvase
VSRLLGIDVGDRRIGLALADEGLDPPHPLATIRRAASVDDDAAVIRRIVLEQAVDELIVGLPLEASGIEGTQADLTRQWALAIAERIDLPLGFRDERLTSHRAEQRLGPMKRGRSGGPPTPAQRDAYRARVDRESAAIILEDELDDRATEKRAGNRVDATPEPTLADSRRGDMEHDR